MLTNNVWIFSFHLVSIVHCWILTLTIGMESTFFHLSAEKIQWLDMEWMQAGARSPQFPGDNIQHSQPYYFPLLIMSLSSSRSPRSPRTSVHNCCDVSVPQSERQVKCPNHVSCHRFSPNDSSSFSRFGDDGCPRSLQAFLDSISPNLYFRYRWERLRDQCGRLAGVILGNTRGIFEYSQLTSLPHTRHKSRINYVLCRSR